MVPKVRCQVFSVREERICRAGWADGEAKVLVGARMLCVLDTWGREGKKSAGKKSKKVCNGSRAPLWLEVFGP